MSNRVRAAAGFVLAGIAVLGGSATAQAAPDQPPSYTCDRGEFCVWGAENYQSTIHRIDLAGANPEECIPLPEGFDGRSFVNRTSRAVTVYQGRDCSPEGDFSTYPGEGTYVPTGPFLVRGVQLWN